MYCSRGTQRVGTVSQTYVKHERHKLGLDLPHLFAAHVAESSLVSIRVGTEQVCGDGMLEERVTEHLQPLQVEAVAGVG